MDERVIELISNEGGNDMCAVALITFASRSDRDITSFFKLPAKKRAQVHKCIARIGTLLERVKRKFVLRFCNLLPAVHLETTNFKFHVITERKYEKK
jgi:hypothetical protein